MTDKVKKILSLGLWRPQVVEEPQEGPALTITDGRYGRLDHLLTHDPDGYGWLGLTLEEKFQAFHTPISPAERYDFEGLTLDDFAHAINKTYQEQ